MNRKKGIYEMYIKRPQDFLLALVALITLSPVLVMVALLVRLKLGSPVLFYQNRPGVDGKIFKMYKFRTMTDARDDKGELLPDVVRLTHFGRILRSSSLDELPELWNILAGEMALVGPRPLLVQYLPLYNEHQKKRHLVRPGLSGNAQVNGRNSISWEQRFDLDVVYVDHITFLGDWKIIIKTLKKVFRREDISSTTNVTMEDFLGTNQSTSDGGL